MKSPRTTTMREWLVRICLRGYPTELEEIPSNTRAALLRGGWIIIDWASDADVTDKGFAWVHAFKDGTKSIGGAK